MLTLSPWVLADTFPHDNPALSAIKPSTLDCQNPKYNGVLTGIQLKKKKYIVDFIPFGYDLQKLEVRMTESFDVVDAFVIYESTRTQR